MEYEKIHVEVAVRFLKEGGMRPIWVEWEDGRKFPVDRVRYIERASARVQSVLPVRYVCMMGGREKRLYFEPEELRWFVEAPKKQL